MRNDYLKDEIKLIITKNTNQNELTKTRLANLLLLYLLDNQLIKPKNNYTKDINKLLRIINTQKTIKTKIIKNAYGGEKIIVQLNNKTKTSNISLNKQKNINNLINKTEHISWNKLCDMVQSYY